MTEGRLAARLSAEGLDAQAWSNGPGDTYAAHRHAYDKVIVVARGSIAFGISGQASALDLVLGDRLELPAGTEHWADVGPGGVTCLEAHQPAGTLAPGPRCRSAGDW